MTGEKIVPLFLSPAVLLSERALMIALKSRRFPSNALAVYDMSISYTSTWSCTIIYIVSHYMGGINLSSRHYCWLNHFSVFIACEINILPHCGKYFSIRNRMRERRELFRKSFYRLAYSRLLMPLSQHDSCLTFWVNEG